MNTKRASKALTLLEIVFALSLISFLITSIAFIYIVSLRGWENLGHRTDMHERVHFGLERVVRELRQATTATTSNHSVNFVLPTGASPNFYTYGTYYLYNANDTWPPAYNQSSYELHRVVTGIGHASPFTYGSGDIIITGLRPPTETSITSSGTVINLKFTAFEENETLTAQGYAHPRNS